MYSKLSNIVDNDVVKKTAYNQFVIKVSAIDTKIPSISGLVTKKQNNLDKKVLYKNFKYVEKNEA